MNSNYDENDICDLEDLMNYYRIDRHDLIELDRKDDECYRFEEEILNNSEEY